MVFTPALHPWFAWSLLALHGSLAWRQELALARQRGGAALRVAVLTQLARAQQLLGQSSLQVATLQKAQDLCAKHSSSPDGCAPACLHDQVICSAESPDSWRLSLALGLWRCHLLDLGLRQMD